MALQVVGGCTIAAGQVLSNGVDCSGSIRLVRIVVPDSWSAAPITFQLSPDGDKYHNLCNLVTPPTADAYRGYEVVVPNAQPGSTITLPIDSATSVNWIKLRSGTPAAPVPQQQDCTFSFVAKFPDPAPAPTGH